MTSTCRHLWPTGGSAGEPSELQRTGRSDFDMCLWHSFRVTFEFPAKDPSLMPRAATLKTVATIALQSKIVQTTCSMIAHSTFT